MGTEHFNVYKGKCLCGKGEINVDECSPDHIYASPSQSWWEANIKCHDCSIKFEAIATENTVNIYQIDELKKMKTFEILWHDKRQEIEKYLDSHRYYENLERLINSLKSKKAIFNSIGRYLVTRGGTYQTFIKYYKGCSKDWIKDSFSPEAIKKMLMISDQSLDNLIMEANDLYRKSNTMPNPVKTIKY